MLILVRIIALSILVVFLNYLEKLGTPLLALCLSIAAGTYAGFYLAKSKLKLPSVLLALIIAAVIFAVSNNLFSAGLSFFFSDPVKLHSLQLHIGMLGITGSAALLSTFLVCRSRHALSLEVFVLVCGFVYFFAGHRDFNFQSPQILGDLAWDFAISPLTLLSILSVALLALVLLYLRLSNDFFDSRDSKLSATASLSKSNRAELSKHWLRSSTPALAIVAILFIVGNLIFSHYKIQASQKTSMGVGQGKNENQSPLGFNSALGASNQPAALVRLEGDYSENPYIPVLYFRESALSLYNGVEMVAAGSSFDLDVPSVATEAHYKAENPPIFDYRVPLQQSIFPLSEHKLAFAVDLPTEINPLKNPDPKRFKAAYKAHSMVPAFDIKNLQKFNVGNPDWDETTKQHYLKMNSDPRYKELAIKITADFDLPIQKAQALTDFLSQKSIYTLSPGHDVPANGDQTAPYLFGDMRGYCVHFAHALTYLFRSLGIPARVSTGYQTDLSQSRDGHILLRMSDRHAWSEVFVNNLGWIPFDPKPQQVESHAETPVDMNLLEELMDLVGPSEEILPKDLAKSDPALQERSVLENLPDSSLFLYLIALVIVAFFTLKFYLWNSWRLPVSRKSKSAHYYRSLLARIYDLGITRNFAETRQEFRSKVSKSIDKDLLPTTDIFIANIYSSNNSVPNTADFKKALSEFKKLPLIKRLKALLSLQSLKCLTSKGGW